MLALSSLQSTTSCTNHREDHTGDIDLYQPNALLEGLYCQMLDLAQVFIRLLAPTSKTEVSSRYAIQYPVGQGFMQMLSQDFFFAFQIGNRSRDAQYPMVGTGREA